MRPRSHRSREPRVAVVNGYGQSESPHITGTRSDDSDEDWRYTADMPRTASGKIRKKVLADEIYAEMAAAASAGAEYR